jgi:putative phage-type endonuclease
MTLHEYPKVDQGSPEWHTLRRGIVTASVVGKLITPTLKVADNDTSRGLTATLVAERITGFTEDTPMNADMWRGVDSEPIARDIYSGLHQQAVETGFMLRKEQGWQLGYSPDGLIADDGLLEIKAPRQKTHLITILSGVHVPAHYMAQCQAGLLVSGRKWLDFVSYCGGMPLWVSRVYPNHDWFEVIEAACRRFEETAAEMVDRYTGAVDGLPATERIVELEMSL